MKTKKERKAMPIDTTYLYYNEEEFKGMTKIVTSKGDLLIPRIPKAEEEKIKKDGWHLLREEYYNTVLVDVLVLRFYIEPVCVRWKVFNDRPLSDVDSWWHIRCGEIIPPFNWDGTPTAKAEDYVIGWKPHRGETQWKGIAL